MQINHHQSLLKFGVAVTVVVVAAVVGTNSRGKRSATATSAAILEAAAGPDGEREIRYG